MDTCKNCGKPLENPDQELCPACRAVENAKARRGQEEAAAHTRRRRMNRTTHIILITAALVAAAILQSLLNTPLAYGNDRMADMSLSLAPLRRLWYLHPDSDSVQQ